MKMILVTGSSGFLGRHFCKYIPDDCVIFACNSKTANLHDYDALVKHYWGVRFDYIYHFAAKTKAGDYCLTHKGEQWVDNQLLNTNILRFWAEHQPQAKMYLYGYKLYVRTILTTSERRGLYEGRSRSWP